jgi:hypothetical protein
MQGTILLNYSENTRMVEAEERFRFLRGILEQCFENTDVLDQVQDIWGDTEGELSTLQKIKLRTLLTQYSIQMIDDNDGGLKLYLDRELIGNWKKPKYVLKRDPAEFDRKKQFFLEMKIDFWSMFDNEEATDKGS